MTTKESSESTTVRFNQRKRTILLIVIIVVAVAALGVAIGLTAYFVARNNRTVTITFNTTVAEVEPITVKWGEVPELPVLTQEGYEFFGWYTEDDVLVDEAFFADFDYLTDLVLHPVWRVVDAVTVTYVSRGGTNVEPLSVPRGYTKSVAGQTERDGFYLLGWCFDEQCLNMYYPEEYVVNSDITLYAKWLPRNLGEDVVGTINYNTMGGEQVDAVTLSLGQAVALADVHREGYAFVGWYSDKDYTYPVDSDILLTQSCVLYAKWAPNDDVFTIAFSLPVGAPSMESVRYRYDALVRESDFLAPSWESHRLVGYFADESFSERVKFPLHVRSDLTIYVAYEKEGDLVNTVTFALYDDVVTVQTYALGTTLVDWTPSREGYVFDGWYSDEARTHSIDLDVTPTSDGLIVYAGWIAESDFADDAILYEISSDGTYVSVAGLVDRSIERVTIPDEFRNLPVREISERAFYGCMFTSAEIGQNVQSIGANAFSDNNFLAGITLPAGVTSVGQEAFARCSQLASVTVAGIAQLGDGAFRECALLQTVSAQFVSRVGLDAFRGCTSLSSVDVTYVGVIESRAFLDCTSLSDVRLAGGVLAEIPSDCFSGCTTLSVVNLPSSVKTIGYNAFADTSIVEFDTKGCERVRSGAFRGVKTLVRFKIGAALQELEVGALAETFALQAYVVDAANTVYSAIDGALYDKAGTTLYAVGGGETCTISASVDDIYLTAFLYAKQLKNVVVAADNAKYSSVDGVLYTKDEKTLLCYPAGRTAKAYLVPDGTLTVNSAAFAYNDYVEEITLPAELMTVSQWAFYELPELNTIHCMGDVVIPEGDMGAVYACPKAVVTREE